MKWVLILILSGFINVSIYADCIAVEGFVFWPTGQFIKQNSIFVINGYRSESNIFYGLGNAYPIYLKSGNDVVQVEVQEIIISGLTQMQAILKPEKLLKEGLTYTIFIDSLPQEEGAKRLNQKVDSKKAFESWTVEKKSDEIAPNWNKLPTYISSSFEEYGCGPAYINFMIDVKDDSEILVGVAIKRKNTGTSVKYYLKPENGELKIGRNMCNGIYTFHEGEEYEFAFEILDASSNKTTWKGKPSVFFKAIEKE